MASRSKRPYRSDARVEAAERTRSKVLEAGRFLFSRKGIDATTIAQIAERAGVSEPTVYATMKSKAGLLHALMHDAMRLAFRAVGIVSMAMTVGRLT